MKIFNLNKINSILVFGFGVIAALYFGANFFVPLTFAIFLATLMVPLVNRFEKWGMGQIGASTLATILVFLVVTGILTLFFVQLQTFVRDLPSLERELSKVLKEVQFFLEANFGLTLEEQEKFYETYSHRITGSLENMLAGALQDFLNTLLYFLLVLVYLFLILLKRDKYEEFLLRTTDPGKKDSVLRVMHKTVKVSHHYLWGRVKVMSILGLMYLIAFWAFGVEHIWLLTIFGAVITVIPYIGPFVSGLVPVVLYLLTGNDFFNIVVFTIVVVIIQLIESYILEPVIIGAEVHLSPLTIILIIVIGGMVWGIPGMILFVPITGVIKIFLDHSRNLQPYGFLIGDSFSKTSDLGKKVKKLWKK